MPKCTIERLIRWYKQSPQHIAKIRQYVSDYVKNRDLSEAERDRIWEKIMGDR